MTEQYIRMICPQCNGRHLVAGYLCSKCSGDGFLMVKVTEKGLDQLKQDIIEENGDPNNV